MGYIDEDGLDNLEETNEGERGLSEDLGEADHEPFWKDRRGHTPTRRLLTVVGRNLSINHEIMVRHFRTKS